jgi:hypothetical protein
MVGVQFLPHVYLAGSSGVAKNRAYVVPVMSKSITTTDASRRTM